MIYEVAGTGAKGSNDYYWQSFEFMFVLAKGKLKTSNRLADRKNKRPGNVQGHMIRPKANGDLRKPELYITPEYSIRTNIWQYHAGKNGEEDTSHPAPFPEALARDHILSWSNPGDLVLDPMCGSGTTCKMAKEQGRHWLGFDISLEYVELARRRVEGGRIPLFTLQPNGAINA